MQEKDLVVMRLAVAPDIFAEMNYVHDAIAVAIFCEIAEDTLNSRATSNPKRIMFSVEPMMEDEREMAAEDVGFMLDTDEIEEMMGETFADNMADSVEEFASTLLEYFVHRYEERTLNRAL